MIDANLNATRYSTPLAIMILMNLTKSRQRRALLCLDFGTGVRAHDEESMNHIYGTVEVHVTVSATASANDTA